MWGHETWGIRWVFAGGRFVEQADLALLWRFYSKGQGTRSRASFDVGPVCSC